MTFNFRQAAAEAERKVMQEMAEHGRVTPVDFSEDVTSGRTTLQEMIGTSDGAAEFLEKITYDLAAGQQSVALKYKSIYDTQTDPNFPEVMTEKSFGNVQTVFLEKLEGGEIKFGSIGGGEEQTVRMRTWASGIEYDEDIVEYNQTWRVSAIGESFGVSYNNLLNHLHFSPIVDGEYDDANAVAADTATQAQLAAASVRQRGTDTVEGVPQVVTGGVDNANTWKAVSQILPKATVVLHNSFDGTAIQTALATDLLSNGQQSPSAKKFSNAEFIDYDGVSFEVGMDKYEYPGVELGEAYAVVPKNNFKEKIKHDLRVDSGDGDLSRLIVTQIVGRARRGLLAGLGGENGVVKVTA